MLKLLICFILPLTILSNNNLNDRQIEDKNDYIIERIIKQQLEEGRLNKKYDNFIIEFDEDIDKDMIIEFNDKIDEKFIIEGDF